MGLSLAEAALLAPALRAVDEMRFADITAIIEAEKKRLGSKYKPGVYPDDHWKDWYMGEGDKMIIVGSSRVPWNRATRLAQINYTEIIFLRCLNKLIQDGYRKGPYAPAMLNTDTVPGPKAPIALLQMIAAEDAADYGIDGAQTASITSGALNFAAGRALRSYWMAGKGTATPTPTPAPTPTPSPTPTPTPTPTPGDSGANRGYNEAMSDVEEFARSKRR